jgi:hypothetical protein
MKQMANVVKQLSRAIVKNSPTILTGLGVVGLLSTVTLAVAATPKALRIIKREARKPLSKADVIRLTWRTYIPTAIMGATTTACIIGANSISLRRNESLLGLYLLTREGWHEYRSKVVDIMGEKKAAKVDDEIADDRLKNDPANEKTVIITGKGDVLCYDLLSGRYFNSNIETLRRIENTFNHQLLSDMFMTLNELYSEMGLPPIELGRTIGWTAQRGLLDFKFNARITPDGTPCLVVEHHFEPSYDD